MYGLFGCINNATIKNLNLAKVNIVKLTGDNTSTECVGGLVGFAFGDNTIEKVTVSGNISGTDSVGGIIGMIREGTSKITNCTSSLTISSDYRVGGVIGGIACQDYNKDTIVEIRNCKFNGPSIETKNKENKSENTIAGIVELNNDYDSNKNIGVKVTISGCEFDSNSEFTDNGVSHKGRIWACQNRSEENDCSDTNTEEFVWKSTGWDGDHVQ